MLNLFTLLRDKWHMAQMGMRRNTVVTVDEAVADVKAWGYFHKPMEFNEASEEDKRKMVEAELERLTADGLAVKTKTGYKYKR